MIDNFGNQIYPGSVDNGATDTEHSPIMYPPKSKGICAADERHADHEIRIIKLELMVHRLLNSEPAHPPIMPSSGPRTLTEEYLQGYTDGLAAASHVPEADYAHIPAAEWEAICAELEGLRAWKASVPWKSIERLLNDARNEGSFLVGDYVAARQWLDANAPKGIE